MTEEGGIWHAKLTEREDYSIAFARASCGKDGKTVCGDTSSAFRGEGGKYIMTISDGMGSGKEAERDSMLTVSFLEKLLKAGFDKESALKLVNSVLMLKSNEETFATVDITVINLVTGLAEFVKAGAAPTYVKRGTSVYELGCSSLPAGILAEARFEKARCKLKESDMIIMASDGVTSVGSKLLTKIASDYKGESPAELAEIILNEAIKINGKVDDMTVAVGYFTKK
jgi:stage II sporulation protein E